MQETRNNEQETGFTMIETLMAITLLILAVTGAYAAAQNGISSAIFSKDQIVAFYLAQEGIEVVRNRRDQNSLSGDNWLSGITDSNLCSSNPDKKCKVDGKRKEILNCSQGTPGCGSLQIDSEGFYTYDSNSPDSLFKREVWVTKIEDDEYSILVIVTWSKGLLNREFRARENIFNWQ